MRFRRNEEGLQRIWVDRGIDGRVDDFSICGPCTEKLLTDGSQGMRWHDGNELCPSCHADFQAHALAVDLMGLPRPFNGMLEDRVLTNAELEAALPPPVPGALDYFLPTRGNKCLPSQGDAFGPRSYDGYAPGPDEAFQSEATSPFQATFDGAFQPDPDDYLM